MTNAAPSRIHATTVAIDDPGDLLALVGEGDVAWVRRGDGMVGLGQYTRTEVRDADEASAWWNDFASRIEHSTELPGAWGVGPVAFGSMVFDADHTGANSVMIVPRIVIGRRDGQAWLTSLERATRPEPQAAAAPGALRSRPGDPDAAGYARAVAEAVARINDASTPLEKVVLARTVVAHAERPLSLPWLASRLAAAYPTCWTYAVDGLVGASPEMLLRAQGGLATSRVLAGTIRRGAEERDDALAEALADSGKDREEHRLAVESVAAALRPVCSGMNVPDAPFVLQLPNVMHLASDVTGVMDGAPSSLALAGRLHPSAAVCGTPTVDALATIAELEGLDRGRYAGPVGWIDTAGDGEWAIALRCGQVGEDPREITLYAGCGIVGRSLPDAEVAETRAKLRPMLDALGIDAADD